jgi:type 1 fimbria pilin
MRFRILASAGVAVAAAAVLAVPGLARPALTHQVNVTIHNSGCSLQLNSVSRVNTTIVFHVINDSAKPAGIVIYSLKSKFAAPKKGASDLTIKFRGAGHYPYTCVAGSYKHPTKIASGVFTIRQK